MPEPAAWRYQKITKPMFDLPLPHLVLTGRVLTMAGPLIEDGFVEIRAGKIAAVGGRASLVPGDARRGARAARYNPSPWETSASTSCS